MSGRYAFVVANDSYEDTRLRRLRAPAADAEELGRVLRDAEIGGFDVEVSMNEPEHVVRRRVSSFFDDRGLDDLLLLHLSCHGLKDDDGRLYFATVDTELDHLEATAIPSEFVNRQMTRSRSRRIVLLLDCCYSGAFATGLMSRAGDRVDIKDRFDGRGRVVLTASSAMEYSFEGDALAGEGQPSVFTSALVRGLTTGEADRDRDGWISVDELYDYAYDAVRAVTPSQTPGKWVFDVQGDLVVARSRIEPEPEPEPGPALPPELVDATRSPLSYVRVGAVEELAALLASSNERVVTAAREALEACADDDSRRVADAAARALGVPEVEEPAQVEPAPVEPAPEELAALAPVVELPVRTEPVQPEPVQPALVEAAPVDAAPAQPEAARLAPVAYASESRPKSTAEPPPPPYLRWVLRAAAVALLVSCLVPLVAEGGTSWNLFALLGGFEAIAAAVVVWIVARRLATGLIPMSFAAGILTAIGVLGTVASLGLVKFANVEIGSLATLLSLIVLAGAVAILAAGVICTRLSAAAATGARVSRGAFALGLAGTSLAFVALFVDYDGYSSLYDELVEGGNAEFFFEAAVAVVVMAAGLYFLGSWPRYGAALLLTAGGLTALHFLGVLVAAAKAIGEPGEVRGGGWIGLFAGLLAAGGGALAYRSGKRETPAAEA